MSISIENLKKNKNKWPFKDAEVGDVFTFPVTDDGFHLKAQKTAATYSSSNGKGAKFVSKTLIDSDGNKVVAIGRVE